MIEFLSNPTNAGTIGLLFFFIVFCYIAFMTFRPSKKQEINELGKIPLKNDN